MVIFVMIQLISFCQTYEYFENAILLLRNETHCVVISCYISHVYLGCIVLEVMSNQNGIVLVEYIYVWQILSDWNVIQAEWSQCQVEGYLFIWSQKIILGLYFALHTFWCVQLEWKRCAYSLYITCQKL